MHTLYAYLEHVIIMIIMIVLKCYYYIPLMIVYAFVKPLDWTRGAHKKEKLCSVSSGHHIVPS